MPVSALEIYKHLPKKNCGECGVPTCLAFAMQLANMRTELEKCPYVGEEAKELLSSAAAPPIKLVKIGVGDMQVEIGDETVMFRHDKRFNHPTAYALELSDKLDDNEIAERVTKANKLRYERIGETIRLDLLSIRNDTADPNRFAEVVSKVQQATDYPLILVSTLPNAIEAGLKLCGNNRPLIHSATERNWEAMAKLAKNYSCPLVVEATELEQLAELTTKLKQFGVDQLVLDFGKKPLIETLKYLTVLRRLAIKKNYRPLGYPVITFLDSGNGGSGATAAETEAMYGVIFTLKYASAIVFKHPDAWKFYPLLTLRQNIFTDPQKPVMVKPGIYEVGQPTPESPLFVTTNFSLTYFTVQGDIEKSKVASYILVVDTEGLSVLTAFAADKFTAEMVAKDLETTGIASKLNHKRVIIPGLVARMSGELNELSGWEVIVGPRDSAGIPKFVKEMEA